MKKTILILFVFLFSTNISYSEEVYLDCRLLKIIDHEEKKTRDFLNDEIWSKIELHFIYKIRDNTIYIIRGYKSEFNPLTNSLETGDIDVAKAKVRDFIGLLLEKTDTELIYEDDKKRKIIVDRITFELKEIGKRTDSYHKCVKKDVLH